MDRKYLRENKNSFNIVKNSKIYAKITAYDDTIFIRDLLIQYQWDLNRVPSVVKNDGEYMVGFYRYTAFFYFFQIRHNSNISCLSGKHRKNCILFFLLFAEELIEQSLQTFDRDPDKIVVMTPFVLIPVFSEPFESIFVREMLLIV